MGGALFSGLLRGFGGVMEKQAQQEHDDKQAQRRAQLQVLSQIDPTQLDPDGQKQYSVMIDGVLTPGGKGKKSKEGGIGQVIHSIFLGGGKGQQKSQDGPPAPPTQGTPVGPQKAPAQVLASEQPPAPPSQHGSIGGIFQHMLSPEQRAMRDAKIKGDANRSQMDADYQHTMERAASQYGGADKIPKEVQTSIFNSSYDLKNVPQGTWHPLPGQKPQKGEDGKYYLIEQNTTTGVTRMVETNAPAPPKKSAIEEKRDEAVAAYQSTHPDASPEEALTAVRKREDTEATLKIDRIRQMISSGQLTAARARLGIQKLKEGSGAGKGDKDTRAVAKTILAEARARANRIIQTQVAANPEAAAKLNSREMTETQMREMGYDPQTIYDATAQGTSLGKPKGGSGKIATADDLARKLGLSK